MNSGVEGTIQFTALTHASVRCYYLPGCDLAPQWLSYYAHVSEGPLEAMTLMKGVRLASHRPLWDMIPLSFKLSLGQAPACVPWVPHPLPRLQLLSLGFFEHPRNSQQYIETQGPLPASQQSVPSPTLRKSNAN